MLHAERDIMLFLPYDCLTNAGIVSKLLYES